jgi:hypothetical protein
MASRRPESSNRGEQAPRLGAMRGMSQGASPKHGEVEIRERYGVRDPGRVGSASGELRAAGANNSPEFNRGDGACMWVGRRCTVEEQARVSSRFLCSSVAFVVLEWVMCNVRMRNASEWGRRL